MKRNMIQLVKLVKLLKSHYTQDDLDEPLDKLMEIVSGFLSIPPHQPKPILCNDGALVKVIESLEVAIRETKIQKVKSVICSILKFVEDLDGNGDGGGIEGASEPSIRKQRTHDEDDFEP